MGEGEHPSRGWSPGEVKNKVDSTENNDSACALSRRNSVHTFSQSEQHPLASPAIRPSDSWFSSAP